MRLLFCIAEIEITLKHYRIHCKTVMDSHTDEQDGAVPDLPVFGLQQGLHPFCSTIEILLLTFHPKIAIWELKDLHRFVPL